MNIGQDIKKNHQVEFSTEKSRVVLITGKRGSGKSYTLGVLAEELFNDALLLLIDPLGIFWTFCLSDTEVDLDAGGLSTTVLTPGDPVARYGKDVYERKKKLGVVFRPLRLNPSDISPSGWCQLFGLTISEPQGIALFRAVQNLAENDYFSINELMERVIEDPRPQDKTKEALVNRLEMAAGWDIFSDSHEDIWDKLDKNSINVLDLSVFVHGAYGIADLIVSEFCRNLFGKRVKGRQRENLGLAQIPERVWLLVDEAQRFVPAGKSTFSKDILISWVKEGRQPGLSAVFATQQPSSIDNDILSQCDLILCHRLSNREDIAALNRLSQDYLGNELKTYIRHVKNQGEALMLDDFSERMAILQVKERRTLHGGGEEILNLFE